MATATKSRADLTFKYNATQGRHGWLRLTPAYSVKLVHDLLAQEPAARTILDPFSGTGTTGLVCAELGLRCDLLEMNPFLVWLARAKTANYSPIHLRETIEVAEAVTGRVTGESALGCWVPPLANIERWWSEERLLLLARLREAIYHFLPDETPTRTLLLVAFCRSLMDWSDAAFNHQSLSFKKRQPSLWDQQEAELLLAHFCQKVQAVVESAAPPLTGCITVTHADARQVPEPSNGEYDCVITSPPYPNRMSYIRELRPYMYWLKYFGEAREAGELDWKLIGGTWGIATSRIGKWSADQPFDDHAGFGDIIAMIGAKSPLLANYVHKYFVDMVLHIRSLFPQIKHGGRICYIVGNSKFYDTVVPVEEIYASILRKNGFAHVRIVPLRKRNSKKELYEFVVSATRP